MTPRCRRAARALQPAGQRARQGGAGPRLRDRRQVRYLGAGAAFAKVGGAKGLSAEILGPPKEKQFFSRMDPPVKGSIFSPPGDTTGAVHPFPASDPRRRARVRRDRQGRAAAGAPEELAALQERAEAPADVWRWLSTTSATTPAWSSSSASGARRCSFRATHSGEAGNRGSTPTAPANCSARSTSSRSLITAARSHAGQRRQGSQGRRPGRHGVDAGKALPHHPGCRCSRSSRSTARNVAVRSDWIECKDAPPGPAPRPKLPKGFKSGEVWIDYKL